jgi:predicted metal-binding membrane protein
MSMSAIPQPKTARPSAWATTGATAATIGLAAAGWALSIPRMSGMDMGVATTLGSFSFFMSVWVPMMAAMMLPGLILPAVRVAATQRRPFAVPFYIGSYLTVWALVGVLVYAVYRPHSAATAGVLAVTAGLYELTPRKRRFRQACRDADRSGWQLGLCCVGSSAGLMVVMLAFGAMSLTWMAVIAAAVLIQKILPSRPAVDVPVAIAIVALGVIELAR